ncbi:MAG: arginine repressor [Oscillospiraceae bacterium]|nr:arginine repressor [Oscillospiraceae bacterium]
MKISRLNKILELIEKFEVNTQEDLAELLKESGFDVTQATVSRDIKELKLIKVSKGNGIYKYATMEDTKDSIYGNKMLDLFKNSVLNIEQVKNFVLIKTTSGAASGAAEFIDNCEFKGIAGTIAGDDTIFILTREDEYAANILERLYDIIKG